MKNTALKPIRKSPQWKSGFIHLVCYLLIIWTVCFFATGIFGAVVTHHYGGRKAVRQSESYFAVETHSKERTKIPKAGYDLINLSNRLDLIMFKMLLILGVLLGIASRVSATLTDEERTNLKLWRGESNPAIRPAKPPPASWREFLELRKDGVGFRQYMELKRKEVEANHVPWAESFRQQAQEEKDRARAEEARQKARRKRQRKARRKEKAGRPPSL